MRRFPADRLPDPGERIALEPATSHHLLTVTGIAPGEVVELFDGHGRAVRARLAGVAEGQALLEGVEPPRAEQPPAPRVVLAALLKQQPFDLVVRMAVELGATELRPVLAARSVARGDRADRWQRIAASAAAQCGRADIPAVRPPQALATALADLPAAVSHRLVCLPGGPLLQPVSGPVAVLLGPEGGLTEAEVEQATAAGFATVGLGARTLRADTALAAALARLLP